MSNRLSTAKSIVVVAATLSTTAFAAIWFSNCVKEYGWEGALRYIWEGDAYSTEDSKALSQLEDVEQQLEKHRTSIKLLEGSLTTARVNTDAAELDVGDARLVLPNWINCHGQRLESDLAAINDGLDKLASKIDAVTTKEDKIRKQKKNMSQLVVHLMDRADALLSFYKSGKDTRSNPSQ